MWALWESRVLCEISKPLWARSVRPQGWQRPHRLRRREKFQWRDHLRNDARARKREYRRSGPPRENRSWGILSGFWIARSPRSGGSRTVLLPAARAEAALDLGGTDVVEGRMPPPGIVK